ncbi:MAG: PEP-CTERM sorting domain-containing protein [Fibrobacter sp.]|nr:PEP-CTERM sorting domain-containing protein [Fibrobacter sp.]
MFKRLLFVPLLASFAFADVVTINFNTSDPNIWDHKNATLYSVNVQAELNNALNGSSYKIESAVLKFTGIQNLREPEWDDALHLGMVQVNGSQDWHTNLSPTQGYKYYNDGEDNNNVANKGNFFKNNANAEYTWVDGSDLGYYTDNNDRYGQWGGAYLDTKWLRQGTEHYEGYYYGNDGRRNNGRWERGQWVEDHAWYQLRNYTTEDFDKVLDVALLEELMGKSDGDVGFTFDADCHYMGNVALEITTSSTNVPEPASMSFLMIGLASLCGVCFSRKRN